MIPIKRSLSILYVDSDVDDHVLMRSLLAEIRPNQPVQYFIRADDLLAYLRSPQPPPFLIISEISLVDMSGIELCQAIQQDELLRKKAIPFVFFTSLILEGVIDKAFVTMVQGFFEKRTRRSDQKFDLEAILTYWENSYSPYYV